MGPTDAKAIEHVDGRRAIDYGLLFFLCKQLGCAKASVVVVPGAELLLKPLSVAINGGSPLGTDFVGEAVAKCAAEKKPLGVSAYAGTLLVPIAASGSVVGVLRCADKSSSDSRVGHRFTKVDAAIAAIVGDLLLSEKDGEEAATTSTEHTVEATMLDVKASHNSSDYQRLQSSSTILASAVQPV